MPANVYFDFTSQTPPALPAGCTSTHGTIATATVTLGGAPVVAAHGTVFPAPDLLATFGASIQDGQGGLTKTVATWGFDAQADNYQGLILAWRASTAADPTTGTAYALVIGTGIGDTPLTWRKYLSGASTDILTSAPTFVAGHLYKATVDHTGSGDPVFTLQDLTAGTWWDGTSWLGGAATFALGSDNAITGQGFNSASVYGASGKVRATDYQVFLPGPTQATLTGPTAGQTGIESAPFAVALDQPAPAGDTLIALSSDGPGDTFRAVSGGPAVSSIAVIMATSSAGFILVPGTAGTRHVSISSAGLTTPGSPITFTSSAPPQATAIALSCPAVVTIGAPATLTATANGTLAAAHVLTIADSSGLAIASVTLPAGQATATASFTETRAGSWDVTATDAGSLPVTGCSYVASNLETFALAADLTADYTGKAAALKIQVYTTAGTVQLPWTSRGTAGVTCFETATPGGYVLGFTAPPATYAVIIDPDGTGTATNFTGPVLVSSGRATAAADLDSVTIEPGINARQALALMLAALAGATSPAATSPITFRAAGGTDARIVAETDEDGTRTSVTLTPPA